jgi:Fe-S cluster assembly ATP-binding protein
VTVSADALAAQLEEERAGNPREAPVILEVQGLRAVVADTRQEILNGVDLVIREGEVSFHSVSRVFGRNAFL